MNDILLGLERIPFPPHCKCFIMLFVSNHHPIFTSLSGSMTAQGYLCLFCSNSISFLGTQRAVYGCVALTQRYYHLAQTSPVSQMLKSLKTVLLDFLSPCSECVMGLSQGFSLCCYWLSFWMSLESIARYLLNILAPHPVLSHCEECKSQSCSPPGFYDLRNPTYAHKTVGEWLTSNPCDQILTQDEKIMQRLQISEGGRRPHGESKVAESKDTPDLERRRGEKGQSQ